MKKYVHPHSPWRIFAFSALATVAALVWVWLGRGAEALIVAMVLVAVEVAFSFDNAILNAKILKGLSSFWQTMFLTVGALLAIFGMRLVFPIILVAITAGLGWNEVLNLALNHPEEYAEYLESSHAVLAAFGGAFLLTLALHFFVDDSREVFWFARLERWMQGLARNWVPSVVVLAIVALIGVLPFGPENKSDILLAGVLGVVVYTALNWAIHLFAKVGRPTAGTAVRVGMAGFISFIYLQVLDASFSFDSVLGAFAVTSDVILIAIGLGIGAFWVRSLTVFMVRRDTLASYKYIDHGAHYTIAILAVILLVSIFYNVPEVIVGLVGIGVIGASIAASRQAIKARAS
jgi:hypothetical protein